MILALLTALLVGYVAGGLVNYAADALPAWRGATPVPWGRWRLAWSPARGDAVQPGSGPRRQMVLMITPLIFAVAVFRFDAPIPLLAFCLYSAFFLAVLVIDLEHRRVLNIMLGPAAPVVVGLSLLPGLPGLGSALLGGLVALLLFGLLYVLGRGKLGAGDVKLAAVIGLMTGYPAVWTALVTGSVLGALAALFLLVTRRAALKSAYAYAPYLALGGLLALWLHLGA